MRPSRVDGRIDNARRTTLNERVRGGLNMKHTLFLFTLALALPCAAQETYWAFGITDYNKKIESGSSGAFRDQIEKTLIGGWGARLGIGYQLPT